MDTCMLDMNAKVANYSSVKHLGNAKTYKRHLTQQRLRSACASVRSLTNFVCALWIAKELNASSCGQQVLWSDVTNARADLSLYWTHMPICWCWCAQANLKNRISYSSFKRLTSFHSDFTTHIVLHEQHHIFQRYCIWAPSSEFVSSSIPSWQILTAHAQPFRGARDLAFCLKIPLDSLLVCASSEGSGETARMRRLAWTFAARIGDKYQIRLTRSI